ncbi:MAG: outer membrane lipid asymmetry maintenance protein MlaD [Desulfuromonas sp.]|nr:MAG: outer membrane lipid asymmetry maintenance protein MlaD [Desulfuromonas sp.]
MKRLNVEVAVGIFMVVGFLCFAWLSVRLGDVGLFAADTYSVEARFDSISGLKVGALVEISGVHVGKVVSIRLDQEDYYQAVVGMEITEGIALQEDSIASVRTSGIIGDKFIKISPGGMDELIEDGGEIEETESAISLEELVSKYIFEKD